MLQNLLIRNYALIEEAELVFSPSLTIITGETGAGKSILLGALSLILGERAEPGVLYDKTRKCVVEAHFQLEPSTWKDYFESEELDFDRHTILRREIAPGGKSRAFINDTPVTLSVLKTLCDALVSLHAQSESLELNNGAFQLKVVDSMAGHPELLDQFAGVFKEYKRSATRLLELEAAQERALRDSDYLQFQLREIGEARLEEGEQEKTEQELQLQSHSEEIKRNLSGATQLLSGAEDSTLTQIKRVLQFLHQAGKHLPEATALADRVESSRIELSDIAAEAERLEEKIRFNPEQLEALTERINLIYRLQKKHQRADIAGLLQLEQDLRAQLKSTADLSVEIHNLKKEIAEQRKLLLEAADRLSANRLRQVKPIEKQVQGMLGEMGMPHAVIHLQHTLLPEMQMQSTGLDVFNFLFAANKGSVPQPLRKVASGGELSRLMLAIQSLIADNMDLPTLIFDEIDTGISGETAQRVGRIMKQLAVRHQVISITHLPQIAARADTHYFVYKETAGNRTYTRLKALSKDERVRAVAQMLSGDQPSKAAIDNAKELIRQD